MRRSFDVPHVFISSDTERGILLEKARHPGLECIVQMPGRRIGNNFYFDLVADSGIHATYEYAMCEKDHEYCDHLATRIAEYYSFPAEELTVSQVHYHPAQYDRFSHGDGPANIKLAKQFGGVANGLMWVNPEFHMQFWYIDENGNETPIDYTIDDKAVSMAMQKKSIDDLKKTVKENEDAIVIRQKSNCVARNPAEVNKSGEVVKREKKKLFTTLSEIYGRGKTEKEKANMKIKADYVPDMKKMSMEGGNVEDYVLNGDSEDFESFLADMRTYTVLIPEEYKDFRYEGNLYGYYIPDTRTFNVVTDALMNARSDAKIIGRGSSSVLQSYDVGEGDTPFIHVVWTDTDPDIRVDGSNEAEISVEYYSLQKDVFSRNTGILEHSQMADKQAQIYGLGSGGFFVGLELVKAGIGSIIAADDDVFAYHNICRHVCGIHDVGRFKVDIFKERAADINPNCKVYTFRDLIQHVDPQELDDIVWKDSIILCCTDNRHAGYVCNELADKYHIPMIDAGCGVRASTGEVFYYKPDSGMACYTCAYGEDVGIDHSNQAVRRKFYATETELEKLHFQPGMSLDIELTAIFETKLAIDLLMEGEVGYEPKLLPYINQCTILLNYPVDKEVNPYMQLFQKEGATARPMTWKSGTAEKNKDCGYCSKR